MNKLLIALMLFSVNSFAYEYADAPQPDFNEVDRMQQQQAINDRMNAIENQQRAQTDAIFDKQILESFR